MCRDLNTFFQGKDSRGSAKIHRAIGSKIVNVTGVKAVGIALGRIEPSLTVAFVFVDDAPTTVRPLQTMTLQAHSRAGCRAGREPMLSTAYPAIIFTRIVVQ